MLLSLLLLAACSTDPVWTSLDCGDGVKEVRRKDKSPITIYMLPSAHDWLPEMFTAAERWSRFGPKFDIQLVDPSAKLEPGQVVVAALPTREQVADACQKEDALACARFQAIPEEKYCRIRNSLVVLWMRTPEALRTRVLIHELGHVLGFEHDKDNILSSMFPSVIHGPHGIPQKYRDAACREYGPCSADY